VADPLNPAQPVDDLAASVRLLTTKYLSQWLGTPASHPVFPRLYTPAQQAKREVEFDSAIPGGILPEEHFRSLSPEERAALRSRAKSAVIRLLASTADPLVRPFFDECDGVAEEFVILAEKFDPSLSRPDIHQALRNQWVFNSIQFFLSLPVSLSPSSFAYSLLYPYTDNKLDALGQTAGAKESFLHWLSLRLQGLPAVTPDPHARKVSWLLRMIDEEYPRSRFPLVHDSLVSIHRAQENSLLLHGAPGSGDESCLLARTIEKGGTSVLADGFLVGGALDWATMDLLFGYGVLLQLVDDLQDLREDTAAGHSTPFVRAGEGPALEDLTKRLLRFASAVASSVKGPDPGRDQSMRSLVERSCILQIQLSVAKDERRFSSSFRQALEAGAPVRLSYMKEMQQRVTTGSRDA
jgi:hypothetical protein